MRCARYGQGRSSSIGQRFATFGVSLLLLSSSFALAIDGGAGRPTLPHKLSAPKPDDLDAYNNKAVPVANVTAALASVNFTGWKLLRKYFPALGTDSEAAKAKGHSAHSIAPEFFANYLSEDAMRSPVPLLSAIWSIPESQLSGSLKRLHEELQAAMLDEDYSKWSEFLLSEGVYELTYPARTVQGVEHRIPRTNLSFGEAVRLYAMMVALIRTEGAGPQTSEAHAADMDDFANRLSHQLPQAIPDHGTAAFFLYHPGMATQPVSKEEYEERADVVRITRKGTVFDVEQFPVFLTTDQEHWSPPWIEPEDDIDDTTLMARKVEHYWTRLDGPYLLFRPDQLDGRVVYRATAKIEGDKIVIQAERDIQSRRAVKRAKRPRDYNPLLMKPFVPGHDTPVRLSGEALTAPSPE